jgi:hypothetical protein
LERQAQDYLSSAEIEQLFIKQVVALKKSDNETDAEKAQWERDFFSLTVSNGEIQPFARSYDDKGEIHEFPDLKKSNDRQWSYLIERLGITTNPVLKARYSHILWSSPKKHGDYAKSAIDNYLQLIKIYEAKDKEQPEKSFGFCALNTFRDAYFLAIIVNYKFDEIKSELKRLVSSFNPKSSFSPAVRTQLIKLALDDKKIFTKNDLAGFDLLCDDIARIWISRGGINASISVFEIAERWEMKTSGKNSGIWRRKIAESYESMMRHALEKNEYHKAVTFCMDAIINFRIAKGAEKIRELEQIYQQIKNKVEFQEFSHEFEIKELIQRLKVFVDYLMEGTPEEIIGFLATDARILPNVQKVKEESEKLEREFPLSHMFPVVLTDQQGNPSQNFRTDEEREKFSFLKRYQIEIDLNNKFIIQEILLAGIRENKINTKTVIEFLAKNSWAGKNFVKQMPNNKEITKNWISLLAPALDEYFYQMRNYFSDNARTPNFILCIDSLTLKIEGLLRDFSELNGIPISDVKKDGIAREKLLSDFLDEEGLKKKFSEDELTFLKFLLVEQAGFHLRHRVAHALMNFYDYNFDSMNYLFVGMLRICKYDIVQNEN